jgi:hypothetical protein
MPHRQKRKSGARKPAFPDREIIAKAEGRFAKADKQRASVKANPGKAVTSEQQRAARIKKDRRDA